MYGQAEKPPRRRKFANKAEGVYRLAQSQGAVVGIVSQCWSARSRLALFEPRWRVRACLWCEWRHGNSTKLQSHCVQCARNTFRLPSPTIATIDFPIVLLCHFPLQIDLQGLPGRLPYLIHVDNASTRQLLGPCSFPKSPGRALNLKTPGGKALVTIVWHGLP